MKRSTSNQLVLYMSPLHVILLPTWDSVNAFCRYSVLPTFASTLLPTILPEHGAECDHFCLCSSADTADLAQRQHFCQDSSATAPGTVPTILLGHFCQRTWQGAITSARRDLPIQCTWHNASTFARTLLPAHLAQRQHFCQYSALQVLPPQEGGGSSQQSGSCPAGAH